MIDIALDPRRREKVGLPQRTTYRILPIVAAVALVLIALVPSGDVGLAVVGFGLAGLGCSALLPLTISFGERELIVLGTAATGTIFASYQVGYGIAAFGVGPMEDAGLNLSTIYLLAAGVAIVLAVMSIRLVRSRPGSTVHSRPVT